MAALAGDGVYFTVPLIWLIIVSSILIVLRSLNDQSSDPTLYPSNIFWFGPLVLFSGSGRLGVLVADSV